MWYKNLGPDNDELFIGEKHVWTNRFAIVYYRVYMVS